MPYYKMLRVSLIQTHTPLFEFINLFFELLCALHYSITWGIIQNPSNILNFPLETKLFRGKGEISIVCSLSVLIVYDTPAMKTF